MDTIGHSVAMDCIVMDSIAMDTVAMHPVAIHAISFRRFDNFLVFGLLGGVYRDRAPLDAGIWPDGGVEDEVPNDLDPGGVVRKVVVILGRYFANLQTIINGFKERATHA